MTAQLWPPPAEYLGGYEPGSEEWAAARRGRLGGSEVAAVLDLSPYESRFSLWHRKRGLAADVEDRPEMGWGRRLEDAVAVKFADCPPEYDVRPGGSWLSRDRPWQIAHPDRLLFPLDGYHDPEILEVKTALYPDGWGEEGTDDVPVYYRSQAFHYLDCLGLRRCRLAVLIGGYDYREYVIDLDDDEQAGIRQVCQEFIADVQNGVRPDVDGHDRTYRVMRELHPDIEATEVELSEVVARRFLDACDAEKAIKTEKRHAAALVADEMGRAKKALHDGAVIATRLAKQGGLPYVQAKARKD